MVTEVMPEVKAICSNRDQLAIVRLISSFFPYFFFPDCCPVCVGRRTLPTKAEPAPGSEDAHYPRRPGSPGAEPAGDGGLRDQARERHPGVRVRERARQAGDHQGEGRPGRDDRAAPVGGRGGHGRALLLDPGET